MMCVCGRICESWGSVFVLCQIKACRYEYKQGFPEETIILSFLLSPSPLFLLLLVTFLFRPSRLDSCRPQISLQVTSPSLYSLFLFSMNKRDHPLDCLKLFGAPLLHKTHTHTHTHTPQLHGIKKRMEEYIVLHHLHSLSKSRVKL